MVTIQAAYFLKNGQVNYDCNSVSPNDNLQLEADVTFDRTGTFKVEWKILAVNHNQQVLFYSDLQQISATGTMSFYSPVFTKPLIPETYKIIWVTVYDSNGQTIASGCPGCV